MTNYKNVIAFYKHNTEPFINVTNCQACYKNNDNVMYYAFDK